MDTVINKIDNKRILEAMFEDLAIVGRNRKMLYVSDGFEREYKVKREDVVGQHIEKLEKEMILNPSVARKVFESGEEVIMSHTNREGEHLIIHGIPVFGEDGEIDYVASYSVPDEVITSFQQEQEKLVELLGGYQRALDKLQSYIAQGSTDLKGSKVALESINKIKQYDVSVLFTGESGVGKTTFARYLHENGPRKDGNFVEISCGAIPENLLESELFGYKKGSFTGANKEGKVGLIEMANNGTLFLDEIGELPLPLQAKLLKTLQKKTITPVGDVSEKPVDFRLITATNKNLKEMIQEGKFREDLFYRINVITIEIPPLRQRPEDCVTLIKYFLDNFNLKYGTQKEISSRCMQRLCVYSWPGNIREMGNTIERIILMTEKNLITEDDLPPQIIGEGTAKEIHEESLEGSLPEQIKALEKKIITDAVKKYKTSVLVAKKLGISQPTAARKIKEYIKD
ncbi:MAG: sigma 54-interacting transcriptional regulator [Firmicutes bacterium]|nr:sigma 54-interacting transcriptional regulator [Bacillota bacterium]